MELTLQDTEKFVTQHNNVQWQGWTVEIFESSPNGYLKTKGAFRDGQWGILTTIKVNDAGKYKIPQQYFRTARH